MLSEDTRSFLTFVAQPQPDQHRHAALQGFSRDMLDRPDEAAALLREVVSREGKDDRPDLTLLASVLDEARMARENGQKRGAELISALEAEIDSLNEAGALSLAGSFALGQAWFQASLPAPEGLALRDEQFTAAASHATQAMALGDREAINGLFDALFGSLLQDSDGSLTALHGILAACLPSLPPDSRQALARVAVGRSDPIFADLGCAWLLEQSGPLRAAAVSGLSDRLRDGLLSRETLSRLTILRSWIQAEDTRAAVAALIRDALRKGGGASESARAQPKVHRVVASMIDGSGAQSLSIAVQGASGRAVAVVLIKEGYGIKDAYVIPCGSASEQKRLIADIAGNVDGLDVSIDYVAAALQLAMGDGAARGVAPSPGLIEVAATCGLADLRPTSGETGDMIRAADPEGRIAALSTQARGRLIMASADWDADYPFLTSWFEDSDDIFDALDGAGGPAAAKRLLWDFLERRRQHWARIVARMGLLIGSAGDSADEFIATALALASGRDLKKTPVMGLVFDQTLEVWTERRPFVRPAARGVSGKPKQVPSSTKPPAPEKSGELGRLLRGSPLTPVWLDGYLLATCIAPKPVMPGRWIDPLFRLGGTGLSDRQLQRFLDIVMARYNTTLKGLGEGCDTVPRLVQDLPEWADGVLTAWEAAKDHWPAKALGKDGKAMHKLFERLTDGDVAPAVTNGVLENWIRKMAWAAAGHCQRNLA